MSGHVKTDLRERFLSGMSLAAATVNVVTTDGPAGRGGVTVSAMSSVSADGGKPTLLVCVHHKSPVAEMMIKNAVFCVNVLRADQSDVSDTFAGRIRRPDGDKFACARWRTAVTGAPCAEEVLAAFDCRLESAQRVGTHFVFVGAVQEVLCSDTGVPLIYTNRAYGQPVPLQVAASVSPPQNGYS